MCFCSFRIESKIGGQILANSFTLPSYHFTLKVLKSMNTSRLVWDTRNIQIGNIRSNILNFQ